MRIHKEGIPVILVIFLLVAGLNLLFFWLLPNLIVQSLLVIASVVFLLLVIWFFRNPDRTIQPHEAQIVSPADGKVVVINEALETEYFHDTRIQVSIFMSPLNVHANRYPITGQVVYYKYHPGKYLVAWHPKSSVLNERATTVVRTADGKELLVRQIAGAVARRIVSYVTEGKDVMQGDELGFIKFGSRVDLFLPLGTKLSIQVGDLVAGNISVIGVW